MIIRNLVLSFMLICVSMGCARIKGLGFDYSRLGDQNIEGFEYKQTLPDGTVNEMKFSKQKGGDAMIEALKVAEEAIKRIPTIP